MNRTTSILRNLRDKETGSAVVCVSRRLAASLCVLPPLSASFRVSWRLSTSLGVFPRLLRLFAHLRVFPRFFVVLRRSACFRVSWRASASLRVFPRLQPAVRVDGRLSASVGVFPRLSASFRVSRRLFASLGVFRRLSAPFRGSRRVYPSPASLCGFSWLRASPVGISFCGSRRLCAALRGAFAFGLSLIHI